MSKIVICTNCTEENDSSARYCSKCGYKIPEVEIEAKESEAIKNTKKSDDKKNIKKKIIATILSLIFFFAFFFAAKFIFKTDNIDSELTKIASEINKNCPFNVDKDTRLDGVLALPNKTIQYNYTLTSYSKEEINIEEASEYIFKNSLENIKNNPDMKYLKDKDVNFTYSYKDKKKVYLFKVDVKPSDYN